jgi:glycine/D-amino acid oxidase-like deaminating enzyme
MKAENTHYLIVGQGLSGSILAWQLHQNGLSFTIVDDGGKTSSSKVAGGVVNPISFKRLILSWKAKELVQYARHFYHEIGEKTGVYSFESLRLLRPFTSIEEQNDWSARMSAEPFNELMHFFDGQLPSSIYQDLGVGEINLAGRLDVVEFLTTTHQYFSKNSIQESLDYKELEVINDELIYYKGVPYSGVIFCEGHQYIYNSYFSYLPNNCTKGEIVIIRSTEYPQELISKGCFVMPLRMNDHFVVGATYKWDDLTTHPTEEARMELLEKLEKIGNFNYEVVEHKVGIRPTVPDRRPLIGVHPSYKNVFIFNGMGSKAVMLAPYFAEEFIQFLAGGNLSKEVDIKRYQRYFTS